MPPTTDNRAETKFSEQLINMYKLRFEALFFSLFFKRCTLCITQCVVHTVFLKAFSLKGLAHLCPSFESGRCAHLRAPKVLAAVLVSWPWLPIQSARIKRLFSLANQNPMSNDAFSALLSEASRWQAVTIWQALASLQLHTVCHDEKLFCDEHQALSAVRSGAHCTVK